MKKKIPRCVYCKCENPLMLTNDHKIPKRLGGTDDEKNIQICCWTCNQLKGGLSHEDFLKYRKALKILFELKKLRFNFPSNLQIVFKQEHYPDFKSKEQTK